MDAGASAPVAGSWGVRPAAIELTAPVRPINQLGRIAYHAQQILGASVVSSSDNGTRYSSSVRLLTAEQLHLIYQKTPDVRAGFDQIARVVSTWDWQIDVIGLDPDDDGYDQALEAAETVRQFLLAPNANDWTWQEVLVAWVTDLLKFDQGPVELVTNRDGSLDEIVPVRGGDISEELDEHGRLLNFKQVTVGGKEVILDPEDMLMLQMYRTTEGPGGMPVLESLIYEIISILRGAETIATNVDLNEIPHGLLVVTGIAHDALARFQAETEANRNQEWKMRMLASPGRSMGPVDARWVPFQRPPSELQMAELLMEIRRTIWRVIGVMPVAMGDTESTPRATAEVQLDASHSHLIGPILELLQNKVNSRIVPLLIPDGMEGILEFRFKMERDLTEDERDKRASRLDRLVKGGIISRNEARAEIGLDPIANGDLITVDAGQQALVVLDDVGTETAEEPEPLVDDGSDPNAEEDPAAEDPADPADEAANNKRRRPMRRSAHMPFQVRAHARRVRQRRINEIRREKFIRRKAIHAGDGCCVADADIRGMFDGYRTIDMQKLSEIIDSYTRDVTPLWEQARAAVITSIANNYVQSGFDSERRMAVVQDMSREMSKLSVEWAITTSPKYDAAALLGRHTAGNWVSNPFDVEHAMAVADSYRIQAMTYLNQAGAPIMDVEHEILDLLNQVADARSVTRDNRIHHRGVRLRPDSAIGEVLARAGHIFDAHRHRIYNWAGKLVDLAYRAINASLAYGSDGEWHCEWISLDNERTCKTCRDEGQKGIRPVSHLPTLPGGATECRSRCKCVLVYWSPDEVASGSAKRFGRHAAAPPPATPPRSSGMIVRAMRPVQI